jgi:hypothetical protein
VQDEGGFGGEAKQGRVVDVRDAAIMARCLPDRLCGTPRRGTV